jgi:hypothetical protein
MASSDDTLPPSAVEPPMQSADDYAASMQARARGRHAIAVGLVIAGSGVAWYGFTHGGWVWKVIAGVGGFVAASSALGLITDISAAAAQGVDDVKSIFGLGAANPPPLASQEGSTVG